MVSTVVLTHFIDLFSGNSESYGTHIYTESVAGEKAVGKSYTEAKRITKQQYQDHLEGVKGLGVIPIDTNNNVRFAVIDIDGINIDPINYIRIAYQYELPFNFFRSKSGGIHAYVFFSEDVLAEKAIELLKKFLLIFGLPQDTEIFPKQKRLYKNTKGNWINLPFYDSTEDKTKQFLYDVEGMPITNLKEAVMKLVTNKISFKQLESVYENLPFADGPVCLQALFITKNISNRNIFLFDFATYLKSKNKQTYEELLIELDASLPEPLGEKELVGTIISSQNRTNYSYRCAEAPMCLNCNKEWCSKRPYGKGGEYVSDLSFEEMTQYRADPPYYKWRVNGVEMVFYSESELRSQSKFMDYCMRDLYIIPNKLKDSRWREILAEAFKEIKIENVDEHDDISPGAMFRAYLEDFLARRENAKSKAQILLERVYLDEKVGRYYFRKQAFIKFLEGQKNFRLFTATEIQNKLRKLGAIPDRLRITDVIGNPEKVVRCWSIPVSITEETTNNLQLLDFSKDIDFSDMQENF